MTAPHRPARTDRPTTDRPTTDHATDRPSTDQPTTAPANAPHWTADPASPVAKNNSTVAFDKAVMLPPPAAPEEEQQRFTLSATQVMASMAAAVTAALVGSRLGVAGTVVGAGLASVISVVGGAIFGHSILLTRKRVKRAVLQVRGADGMLVDEVNETAGPVRVASPTAPTARPDDDATVVIPAVNRTQLIGAVGQARSGPERNEPSRPHPTRRRVRTGVLVGVAATAAIFASSLAAVTILETIKGSPLGGGDPGALSVLGGNGGTENEVPAGTTTVEVTEQQTVTQTVSTEATAGQSGTSTSSADSTPSSLGSATSTPSSAPSATSPTSVTSASSVPPIPGAPADGLTAGTSTVGPNPTTAGGSAE